MSIPAHISYSLGITLRNALLHADPRIKEFLRLREINEPVEQETTILNIMDLINEGMLHIPDDPEDEDEDE